MPQKLQTALLLLSLVSMIYVLRDSNSSPGTFLRTNVSRFLADQEITKALCDGVDQEDDVTDNERETAKGHKDSYAKSRGGNPLVTFIEGPEPAGKIGDVYGSTLVGKAVPFIILFFLALCSCFYFTTVWCCLNVSWCKGLKICKGPKPGGYRVVFTIVSIVLMGGLAISGLVGAVNAPGIKKGGYKVVCAAGVFAEKLLEGSTSEDWVGAQQMVEDFQIVLNDFYPMVTKLTAAPSLTATTTASGMALTLTTAKAAADLFSVTNSGKVVKPRPDPLKTQVSYKPTYISNITNVRDALKAEMTDKNTRITNGAQKADTGIAQLRLSATAFFLILQQANDIAANVSTTLKTAESNITAAGLDARSQFAGFGGFLTTLFVGDLLTATLAIVSILLGLMGLRIFIKLTHLSWCIIMVLAIVGWIIAAVLSPTTLGLFEGCDVGQRVLTNSTFFNLTMDKFIVYNATDGTKTKNGEQVKGILYRCYYGDGDLISELGLDPVFNIFRDIFEPLDDLAPLSEVIGPVPDSYIIPQQQNILVDLKTGIVPDAQETIDDLATLNGLTNSKTNDCTQIQDVWVLNSENCPATAGKVFSSGLSTDFNVNNPTCIGFDAWGNNQATKRYSQVTFPQPACGTQGALPEATYLQNFVSNFVNARSSSASVFGDVQSSLSNVASANQAYMKSVKAATASFNPVRTATNNTRKAMWDADTGFIPNANCTFFREATENLVDSLCVRFGNSLYKVMVITIVVSVFGLLGGIVLFCFAFKFFSKRSEEHFNYLVEDHNPPAGL